MSGSIEIPLIVLEKFLFVAFCKIVCHRVSPLERRAALLNFFNCLLHELYLNPRQRRGDLHFFHLLLGFGVQIKWKFGRLLMVRPTIVVLDKDTIWLAKIDKEVAMLTWRYRSNDALLLLWASRASIPPFSSNRLHEYQAVPCSLQGPMHTQQNSCLHFLHVMWLMDMSQSNKTGIGNYILTCNHHSSQSYSGNVNILSYWTWSNSPSRYRPCIS